MTAMRRGRGRWAASGLAGLALAVTSAVHAHVDPPGCGATGASLMVSLYRGDGKTGSFGGVSECERVRYKVTLRSLDAACAFSGGRLTLTTPDGVEHVIRDEVPTIGGAGSSPKALESEPIVYAVRAGDARDGVVTATARYRGGAAHDNDPDTPGVGAEVQRRAEIVPCGDADPCTRDRCDPDAPGASACSHPPVACDDGDRAVADVCAGRCARASLACEGATACGVGGTCELGFAPVGAGRR